MTFENIGLIVVALFCLRIWWSTLFRWSLILSGRVPLKPLRNSHQGDG